MSGETELRLSACPFCGGDPRLLFDDSSDYRSSWDWVIECANDICSCSFGHHQSKGQAIEAWNRRATPPGYEMVPEGTERNLAQVASSFVSAHMLIYDLEKLVKAVDALFGPFNSCPICARHRPLGHLQGCLLEESKESIARYRATQKDAPNAQG